MLTKDSSWQDESRPADSLASLNIFASLFTHSSRPVCYVRKCWSAKRTCIRMNLVCCKCRVVLCITKLIKGVFTPFFLYSMALPQHLNFTTLCVTIIIDYKNTEPFPNLQVALHLQYFYMKACVIYGWTTKTCEMNIMGFKAIDTRSILSDSCLPN